MSNISALSELAGIVGKSPLSAAQEAMRRNAVNTMVAGLEHRPLHRKATDLLGIVLALTARTRRIVQPRVEIDLDVFTPAGARAVKMRMRPLDWRP